MTTLLEFSLELDDGIVVGIHVNDFFPKSCKKGGIWGLGIVGVGVHVPSMTFYHLLKTIRMACPSITFNCVNTWSFFNIAFSNPSSLDVLIFNSFKVSLQGILSIPTHAFVVCVQINYFCNYRCECPLWHLVKMICSCICNLYL